MREAIISHTACLMMTAVEVRDTLILAGSVSSARCALSLAPWSRQVGAYLHDAPLLAQLDIRGIPAHAWAEPPVEKKGFSPG
jgi:hypothetical protein